MSDTHRLPSCWPLLMFATFLATLLAACSGGGGSNGGNTPTPPPASVPVIASFTANPATSPSGQSTQLSWSVTGAATLSLDQGIGDVTGQTGRTVNPPISTAYTLTATNAAGSVTARVCVAVNTSASAVGVGLNAPEILVTSNGPQYANIPGSQGDQIVWTATGLNVIAGANRSLIEFSPTGPAGGSASLAVSVTGNCGSQSGSVTIPVLATGPRLQDGQVSSSGPRAFTIQQLLRGDRIVVEATPGTGSMILYDFQGRRVVSGERIDVRAPVRGSYFLHVAASGNYTLTVNGLREQLAQQLPAGAAPAPSPPSLPTAVAGQLTQSLFSDSAQTYGEDLVAVGDDVVALWYDEGRQTSVVRRTSGTGQVRWTWVGTPGDRLYLRSLAPQPDGGVVGVGACGAAGATDEVCIIRLAPDGTRTWERRLSTPGYDYGYGIAADTSGVFVSGFTDGAFPGFANAGGLDGWVSKLETDGTLAWVRQFGSAADDRPFAVAVAGDQVTAFGDTRGGFGPLDPTVGPGGEADLFLYVTSRAGAPIRTSRFGTGLADLAFDIVADADGTLFLTGMTSGPLAAGAPTPFEPQVYTMQVRAGGEIGWRSQLGPRSGQSGETLSLRNGRLAVLFYTNGSFPGGTNNSFDTRGSDDMVVAEYTTGGELRRVSQFYDTSERIFARGIAQVGGDIVVLRDRVYRPSAPFSQVSVDRFAAAP